jgi:choline dehydrogenase-like flavoprotein
MSERYDVIIIGSGSGGGTLAPRLAPADKRILILERGDLADARGARLERRCRLRRQPLRLQRHLAAAGRQTIPAGYGYSYPSYGYGYSHPSYGYGHRHYGYRSW